MTKGIKMYMRATINIAIVRMNTGLLKGKKASCRYPIPNEKKSRESMMPGWIQEYLDLYQKHVLVHL